MAKTDPEPTFLGVWCNGPNPEHAQILREKAEALSILADFYELGRKEQLVIAAATTELIRNR